MGLSEAEQIEIESLQNLFLQPHFSVLRNTFYLGVDFPFPLFSPSPLKVLFNLEGGNEAHGVCNCMLGSHEEGPG